MIIKRNKANEVWQKIRKIAGVLFHIIVLGDCTSAITYDILYVGETVKEKLTQRFKAHHALQNMLIEEKVISPSFDKSE